MAGSSLLLKLCSVWLVAQLACASSVGPRDGHLTREFPCPIDEEILPCTCDFSDDLLEYYLVCSAAKTEDELRQAFNAPFPFTNFVSLTIDHSDCDDCSLTSLSAGALGSEVSFQTINITRTQITSIEEEVFGASHDTLSNLHLQSNQISEFPFEGLGDYSVLTGVYLQGNRFDSSTPLPPLKSDSLRVIDLNSNPELVIPPDFVMACPSIQRVQLRNGKIREVPIFDESPIGMFTGLQSINFVDFRSNSISEVQTNTIIAEQSTLVTVDFAFNNISILHPQFVQGFSASANTALFAQGNSLVKLDEEVWRDILNELPNENSVDLSENPILCGCDIAWLVLSDPDLRVSLTDTTTCEDGTTSIKELQPAPYEACSSH